MSKKGSGRKHGQDDGGWGVYGGYMAAKNQKLDEQFSQERPRNREISCAGSTIFQGVAIFVDGYTVPSLDELKRLMMIHGGRFIHYYRKTEVTHIIATNLPHAKIRKLNDEKVVRPEWILDSIKAGHLLLYESYQLYGNRTSLQKSLSFQRSSTTSSSISANTETSMLEMPSDATDDEIESALQNNDIQSDLKSLSSNHRLGVSTEMEHVGQKLNFPQRNINTNLNLTEKSPPSEATTGRAPAKAGDPRFVAEFYNNSRLHHISSWGAEFKDLVMQLQKQGDGNFPARDSLRKNVRKEFPDYQEDILEEQRDSVEGTDDTARTFTNRKPGSSKIRGSERFIMHVDMDCFFVSVGLINRPELRGKPVAVTHSRGNGMQQVNLEAKQYEQDYYQKKYGRTKLLGDTDSKTPDEKGSRGFNSAAEIASCSYEARAAGVRNGMFMGEAKKRCPSIQTIPYDFNLYKEVAQKLYWIVARYTHDIEAVSCDEMFVDISELLSDTGATPCEFSSLLRQEIYKETKCNASVGIAHNILLARMSTRIAKPNGQHLLEAGQEIDFIKSQPVSDLPGVGWSMKRRLEALSVSTCGDLQVVSMAKLQREFGAKTGEHLYNLCRGKDDRAIQTEKQRKSVSAEINYGIRFTKESEAIDFVSEVTEEVHRRLLKISMKGKMITLKMKVRKPGAPKESSKFLGHGICNNLAKSVSLAQATDDLKVIKKAVLSLLRQMKIQACDMRGVGVQINKLVPESGEQRHPAAIGTKSLKDFVTSGDKNQSGFTIPDVRPPSVKKPVPKTMMSFLQKQHNQDDTNEVIPKEIASGGSSKPSAVIEENALPKLPTMMPSPTKDEPVTKSDFYPSSISEIDMSVLDALPPDIKLQIQNSFLTRKPDVNQRIPMTSTPVPIKSKATIRTRDQPTTSRAAMQSEDNSSEREDRPTTSRVAIHSYSTSREKEDLPTTSRAAMQPYGTSPDKENLLDLDPSVLKELPEDIVQELLANQQRKKQRERMAEEPVEALPNLSQIEPSCLDALPPDLKLELKQAYLNKELEHERQHVHEQSPVKLFPPKPNLLKQSPQKPSPGKLSPFGTKRRGRPKKGSPRKLFEKNQPKINTVIKRSPIKDKIDINNDKCKNHDTKIPVEPVDRDEVKNPKEDDMMKEEKKRANLNGAVELHDVKALLWEWMETSEFPRDDDLGLVISYMQELVLEKDLVKVDLLLKAFKRYTNKLGADKWKGAYMTALSLVQDRIRQVYNSQLKIS